MILAALIDAGADLEFIRKQIGLIDLGRVELLVQEANKRGIRAAKLEIKAEPAESMPAQDYRTAAGLIGVAGLDPAIEVMSLAILARLCAAEARVHGVDLDKVHLHELGAVDTVVDIVGAAAAFSFLEIEAAGASAVATGSGLVSTQHGQFRAPLPAVVELLSGVPIYPTDVAEELTTPTGAAILVQCCQSFGQMPAMTLAASGCGAGSRDLQIPNVLRVLIGTQTAEPVPAAQTLQMEANIDDMNPEFYEYVIEQLFKAGAQDAWVVPAIGKRGRPASVLTVLADPSGEDAVRQVLFRETSTLGVRTARVSKWMLDRQWTDVVVSGQSIRVKIAREGDRIINVSPEYSDCAAAARRTGLPLKQIYSEALSRMK